MTAMAGFLLNIIQIRKELNNVLKVLTFKQTNLPPQNSVLSKIPKENSFSETRKLK